jgi:hypothetical protein
MENHYKVHGKGKTIGTYFWKSNKKIKIEYSFKALREEGMIIPIV